MAHTRTHIEASLLFQSQPAPFADVDDLALRALVISLGVDVQSVRKQAGEYVFLECEGMQVFVLSCHMPFPLDHFKGVMRPQESDQKRAMVLQELANHASSLTIVVAAPDGEDCAPQQAELMEKVCLEVMDLLMATTSPELIFWCNEDRLMTPEEAETMLCGEMFEEGAEDLPPEPKLVTPRRPERAGDLPSRPAIMEGVDLGLKKPDPHWNSFGAGSATIETVLEHAPSVAPRRPATLRPRTPNRDMLRQEPQIGGAALEWLNQQSEIELDPDAASVKEALSEFLETDTKKEARSLPDTAMGRASLYVMSATIMTFSLPLGGAVLAYNAMRGDFRHTAHIMALTGFGLALTAMGAPTPAAALGVIF